MLRTPAGSVVQLAGLTQDQLGRPSADFVNVR